MLTVDHLFKQFPIAGSSKVVSEINDVSFSIAPGETLGLVGESGSGKTLVGRIIVGLIDPTAGSVRFDLPGGREARGRPPKGKVQLVFQEPSEVLDPRLKIGATIVEPLQALSIERSEWRRRVRDTMGLVPLDPALLDAYPSELSAGQKQRVGVARAMITEPDLVVLDEPTSALDPTARAEIIDLLKRIQAERHTAYLFISHDLSTIRFISHRVAVMYLGMIVEQGEAATLFSQPHHPYSSGLLSSVLLPHPELTMEKGWRGGGGRRVMGAVPSAVDASPYVEYLRSMSQKHPRFTAQTAAVLDMLIANPDSSGADIVRATGLKTGTLYPILMRLEEAGWLGSHWEEGVPAQLGRPRKRFYSVTGVGRAHARSYAQQQQAVFGRLAW